MGPTGARGILKERSYIVKHIFKKSPAMGVLELDDEVVGANGKKFSAHTFGDGSHGFDGPMKDLGLAIEDSEGSNGILELTVKRKDKELKVDIQLEKLGRFADTFPVNCKKTAILRDRAYKYLIDNPGEVSSQGRCVATLALLSSDESRYSTAGKRLAKEWNEPADADTWTWHLGFQGVTLGEYQLLTGDRSVSKTLKATMESLRRAQWQGNIQHWKVKPDEGFPQATLDKHQALYEGGFGHEPYHAVLPGQGYGPMQWPTCLALMTWQLGSQCGIAPQTEGVTAGFKFLENGTTQAGQIAYGGEFTLNSGLVDIAGWQANTTPGFSHKSGLGYLVYKLSPERKDAKKRMKLHLSNIEASYPDMADGHACALMGFTWGLAGVYASDDAKLKKKVTDHYKAWFNLARCHGSDSYVVLPGRDYADFSYYRDNIRNHTTAAMAFIYSFSTPKLRVQGVTGKPDKNSKSGVASTTPTPPLGELRLFYNADRSKAISARLVKYDKAANLVRLNLKNGEIREMKIEALSKDDQEYIEKLTAPAKDEEEVVVDEKVEGGVENEPTE